MRTSAFVLLLSLLSGPAFMAAAAAPAAPSTIPTPSRTLARRSEDALLNPVDANLKAVKVAPALPMTNAQRLKRGLSPNRPSFYRSGTFGTQWYGEEGLTQVIWGSS